jgi:hypothetical protein
MLKKILNRNKEQGQELVSIIDSLLNKTTTKITLDEVIKMYSDKIDQFILDTEKKSNIFFIGGKFKIYLQEEEILINVECFFQDIEKQWIKKCCENKVNLNRMDDLSIQKLKKESNFEFDIAKPQ